MVQEKLQADQIQALKSSDKEKLEVLRFIIAKIKNQEIEKKSALTDDEVVNILRKHVKELHEGIEAFKKGNRQDLVDQNTKQIEIVSVYLPAEISEEELQREVSRLKDENKAAIEANPKVFIGICMKALKSKASPERIMKAINQ